MQKKVLTYFAIVVLAAICALSYQIFVFPNRFAPAGLNGICTMIQHLTGVGMGYLYLLVNFPLALLVYCRVSRVLAVRSMVYVLTFSVLLAVFGEIDFGCFAYETDTGTSTILGPLVAGIISGSCYSMLVPACTFMGGTDFISALIHKNRPDQNFFWISFVLNATVAVASFFVYDFQIEPVILCILYSFMSSTVSERMVKSGREAVRFEIITDHPEALAKQIIAKTHHSTTLVPGKGMYQGKPTSVLICVINKTQVSVLADIVKSHPKTFAIMSPVAQVVGNFKHLKNDGAVVNNLLDEGDGPAI